MSTAGKLDELEAPKIFFFYPIFFILLLLQFDAERAPSWNEQTALSWLHGTLALVCADPQPRHPPRKVLFHVRGFLWGNSLANTAMCWIQGKQTVSKAVTFLQVALGKSLSFLAFPLE